MHSSSKLRFTWRHVLAVAVTVAFAVPIVMSQIASAADASDGDGTMTVSPSFMPAGSTGQSLLHFTFTAPAGNDFPAGSQVTLTVPASWPAPQATSTSLPAFVSVVDDGGCGPVSVAGISGSGPWTVTANQQCTGGGQLTILYGADSGSTTTAPSTPGSSVFSTSSKSGSGGALAPLAGSPTVTLFAPPTKLGFTVQPSSSTNGGIAFFTQPRVAVEDSGGNVVTNDNATQVTLAIGTNPGGGTLTCTSNTVTVVHGVAAFSGCNIDKAGTGYTLVASSMPVLTPATSNPFNITVGPATKLVFASAPQVFTAGTTSGLMTVQRQDAGGNPAHPGSFLTLTLTTTSPAGSFRNSTDTATITTVAIHSNQSTSDPFAYRDTVAGFATVTASVAGLWPAAQVAGITPAALHHLGLSPASSSLAAGGTQAYTAEGFDLYGNSRGDATGATTFTIGPDGSCGGASCTATIVGAHTVSGTDGPASGVATLSITVGALHHLVLGPVLTGTTAGGSQHYTAEGFDAYWNDLGDVTGATTFTISPDGSCTGTACSATVMGTHAVRGTDGFATGTASLVVAPGSADHLALSPSSATIFVGSAQPFTAEGFDAYGNDLGDVTGSTSFTIGPSGSCSGSQCTATKVGAHTVTGTHKSATGSASLSVSALVKKTSAGPDGGAVAPGTGPSSGARVEVGGEHVDAVQRARRALNGGDGSWPWWLLLLLLVPIGIWTRRQWTRRSAQSAPPRAAG